MTALALAAGTAVAMFATVAAFQLALAAGVPWGRASYGGAPDRLPTRLRAASVVAFVIWVLVALVVLRRAGAPVWAPLPDPLLPGAGWVVVALLVPALVLNLITPSRIERAIWAPVSAAALAATTLVNLLA